VDLGVRARDQAQDRAVARVQRHVAADAAAAADRRRAREVPRPRAEPVLARGQRADRAQLDRVAGERRRERLARQRTGLAVAAALERDQRLVAGDLVLEARAAVAQDAALLVEHDQLAERERLVLGALALVHARDAEAVPERVVLQRALAALVA